MKEEIKKILEELGEDTEREGIKYTPERVQRLFSNIFYGYRKVLKVVNEETRNTTNYDSIIPITVFENGNKEMLIRKMSFISFCEHHIVPFMGEIYVGIIPNKMLLGLNKIDKIAQYFSARLQLQERLTNNIADWITDNIEPLGVMVVIKAKHMCAELQGDNGDFITSAVRGVFKKDINSRQEFLKLIGV